MSDFLYVGVDISSKTFDACFAYGQRRRFESFSNEPAGHHRFIQELARRKSKVRVVLEATGIYHLELAYALHQTPDVEVCVLNPRVTKNFSAAMSKRSKSDQRDADTMATYGQCMPFEPWQPPEDFLVTLRSLTRRMTQISEDIRREKTRLHALERGVNVHPLVLSQTRDHISKLKEDLKALEQAGLELVEQTQGQTCQRMELLKSIPGVGVRSALILVSELAGLPSDMDVRQWVAHCGLDVIEFQSGTSVSKRNRISKRGNRFVRRCLFLSAISAPKACERIRAFRQELIDRGKTPKQAAVAVMRKLMHCIYGMWKHNQPYEGNKFRAAQEGVKS